MVNSEAIIKSNKQKVLIAGFEEKTIVYPKKTVVTLEISVVDIWGKPVVNYARQGMYFSLDELTILDKVGSFPTAKPTKDEILWRETQAENQEINQAKTDNYYLTMFPEYFL